MAQKAKSPASSPKVRKISARRLKNLRKEASRTERRLSLLLKRVDEAKSQIDSPEQNGKRKLAMEVEFIDSEVSKLNAALDRISRTHSDYLTKNQRLDQERLGLK